VGEQHGTDASTAGLSAERIARNDAIFRKANEAIAEAAQDAEVDEHVPFICECADPACTEVIRMSAEDYSEIRSDPRHFLNVPGHEASGQGWAQVVETHDGYLVVAKVGPAGEVAEQLEGDPDPATAEVDADDRHSKDETL
jgi:hypothetical protein